MVLHSLKGIIPDFFLSLFKGYTYVKIQSSHFYTFNIGEYRFHFKNKSWKETKWGQQGIIYIYIFYCLTDRPNK